MKQLILDTITEMGYPIYLQGSMSNDAVYPDTFFTFWNNSTESIRFYDNTETGCVWDFDLNVYSNDPSLVNSLLVTAKAELKKLGFIINGKGYDVLSDEETHTGRGINLLYIEKETAQ